MEQGQSPKTPTAGDALTLDANPTAVARGENGTEIPPEEREPSVRELLTVLIKLQEELAAKGLAQQELNDKLKLQADEIARLGAQGHKEPIATEDRREFLDVHGTFGYGGREGQKYIEVIDAGLNEAPPPSDRKKGPHHFDIQRDETYRKLKEKGHNTSAEEYWSLYCNTFYLSVANVVARDEFVTNYQGNEEGRRAYEQLFNTYQGVEEGFRLRISLIRARASYEENTTSKQYYEYLQTHAYGLGARPQSGSAAANRLQAQFLAEAARYKQKASAQAGAFGNRGKHSDGGSGGGFKPPAKRAASSDGSTNQTGSAKK